MNKKENKTSMYSLRIEPELRIQMKLAAKRKGKGVSNWVRWLIYREIANELPEKSN